MTETPTLEASQRDRLGSRYAKRLRAQGRIPAIIYGHGQENTAVAVDLKELLRHLHHGVRVFNVQFNGTTETCLVNDVQFDYLGTNLIHVDFTRVDLTEEVTVNVTLHFVGTPVGLKTEGAILHTHEDSIEVRCKAGDIPGEAINVKIDHLQAGQALTAGDVPLPEGLVLESDPEAVLCAVEVVSEDVEEAIAPEAVEGEPEIIGERERAAEGKE